MTTSTRLLIAFATACGAAAHGAALAQPFPITPGVAVGTQMGANPTSTPSAVACPVANAPVVVMFDVSNPLGSIYYGLWNAPPVNLPQYTSPNAVSSTFGQVFGVQMGDAGSSDVFVSATAVYGTDPSCNPNYYFAKDTSGKDLTGAIWRFNPLGGIGSGGTTDYELVANVPATRASLGHIAYNWKRRLIYATSNDTIYAVVAPGNSSVPYTPNQTAWFDSYTPWPGPFLQPSDVDSGVLPLGPNQLAGYGSRLLGLGYNGAEDKLFFTRVGVDGRNAVKNNKVNANEIWSVALDATGKFIPASLRLELKIPFYPAAVGAFPANSFSFPVSDIAFSDDGKTMFLAERGDLLGLPPVTVGAPTTGAHFARTLSFVVGGSGNSRTWFSTDPNLFGLFNGAQGMQTNTAGGVDVEPLPSGTDMFVWATTNSFNSRAFIGNAPSSSPVHVYGAQRMSYNDGKSRPLPDPLNLATNPPKAFFVDYGGGWSTFFKHMIGGIKVRHSRPAGPVACDCASIESYSVKEQTLTARICTPALKFSEIRIVQGNTILNPTSITPALPLSGQPPYCVNIQVQLTGSGPQQVHFELASDVNPDTALSQCCRSPGIKVTLPGKGVTLLEQ